MKTHHRWSFLKSAMKDNKMITLFYITFNIVLVSGNEIMFRDNLKLLRSFMFKLKGMEQKHSGNIK